MLRGSFLVFFGLALGVTISGLAQEGSMGFDVSQLTLEEKAALITGENFWETHPVPRLGIPSVWMADGPVGLRKNLSTELTDSVPATCFPAAAGMAATFNPALIEQVGAGIGAEARFNDVVLLLGPGLNLKRHPLGGRNFEYYSEDPLLSGLTAAAFVRGVQSQGVGATVKHYAVNNQEYRRLLIDAEVDERTLHELYLRGFEIAIEQGRPQAVMSAYNQVNGTYASQHHQLLTEILRDEWGFDGLVVSDWGAVDNPVASIAAGLDLEMPGNPLTPPMIVEAVRQGRLEVNALDRAVAKMLQLVARQAELDKLEKVDVTAANHELARQVAIESMVLLHNDGVLPITASPARRIGVLGKLAFEPRIQGIGSSQVAATRLEAAWPQLEKLGAEQGHTLAAWQEPYDENGLAGDQVQAVESFAAGQDLVVVFAGQPASHDAEAWDRPSMSMAAADLQLVDAVKRSEIPFVVVLVGGGVMDINAFVDDADAIIMGWLGGQAFGSAVAEVLYGDASPSGRLSETWVRRVADHPSAINFPGGPSTVRYGEGIWVGYRFFSSFGREALFPFGHGLSYTSFAYSRAAAPETVESLDEDVVVTVTVTNTGDRAGDEAVQVYLRHLDPELPRPDRELVGFAKTQLEPGEASQVSVAVPVERFAYYHDGCHQWVIEPGSYELLVGASAADIRATLPVTLTTGTLPRPVFTASSSIGDIYQDPRGRAIMDALVTAGGQPPLSERTPDDFMAAVIMSLPLKKLMMFPGSGLSMEVVSRIVELVNSDLSPEDAVEQLAPVLQGSQAGQQQGGVSD